ncbi:unnamed protein product [Vitrella brassicaformis CCMP3155]|uniref:Uncharacterized protein n=1 Tax=Vitrella brassicaformis (strain CCMP3155) TaxID=1169540 RepID=A0A0G4F8K6_VITBC|nr:unnamed protein product [Vitrella brassicaformis CCMP3155]|eukprot:CEM09077.1 unnamed protein product [Vitrella brassicaformis CCMP3155]
MYDPPPAPKKSRNRTARALHLSATPPPVRSDPFRRLSFSGGPAAAAAGLHVQRGGGEGGMGGAMAAAAAAAAAAAVAQSPQRAVPARNKRTHDELMSHPYERQGEVECSPPRSFMARIAQMAPEGPAAAVGDGVVDVTERGHDPAFPAYQPKKAIRRREGGGAVERRGPFAPVAPMLPGSPPPARRLSKSPHSMEIVRDMKRMVILSNKRGKPSGASRLLQPGSGSGSGMDVGNGAYAMDTDNGASQGGQGGMVMDNVSGVGAVPSIGSLAQQPPGGAPAGGGAVGSGDAAPGAVLGVPRVAVGETTPPRQQQAAVGVGVGVGVGRRPPRPPTNRRGVNRPRTRAQLALEAAAQKANDPFIPPTPSRRR